MGLGGYPRVSARHALQEVLLLRAKYKDPLKERPRGTGPARNDRLHRMMKSRATFNPKLCYDAKYDGASALRALEDRLAEVD
jgi:hypothetical protein